jgi:hypothetical protein
MKKLEIFFSVFVVVVIAVTGYWFNTFFIEFKGSFLLFWFLAIVILFLLLASIILLLQINSYKEKPSGSEPKHLLTNDWMRHPIEYILWSLSDLYQARITQAQDNNKKLAIAVHCVIWFIAIFPLFAFLVLLAGYGFLHYGPEQICWPLFGCQK